MRVTVWGVSRNIRIKIIYFALVSEESFSKRIKIGRTIMYGRKKDIFV